MKTTAEFIAAIMHAANLDDLRDALNASRDETARRRALLTPEGDEAAQDLHVAVSLIIADLPTWGPAMENTSEIYSWDATRYLYMGCERWEIADREDLSAFLFKGRANTGSPIEAYETTTFAAARAFAVRYAAQTDATITVTDADNPSEIYWIVDPNGTVATPKH